MGPGAELCAEPHSPVLSPVLCSQAARRGKLDGPRAAPLEPRFQTRPRAGVSGWPGLSLSGCAPLSEGRNTTPHKAPYAKLGAWKREPVFRFSGPGALGA